MAEAALSADRAHADPAVWIFRRGDEAILADAAALEAEGPRGRPLWGVPFAVKDNIDVAGIPTTAACPGFAYTPDADSPAVRRLLDAGALLIGKTNLDQFASGLVGVRSPYGVPRNVFDPALVPGGSSSGSACAVAAGIVTFALGTDTAGSGRVPAGFGNIVGLKPTIGSISARGMVPACRSVDTISVFARSVDEALAVQRVIAFYDVEDPYARPAPFPHLRRSALAPGRVAIGDVGSLCDPEVAAAYKEAGAFLNAEPVDLALFLEIADLLYEGPWVAERTSALRALIETTPDILYPVTRTILESGLQRLAVDGFDAFYLLQQARRQAALMFGEYDALLLPASPFCPTLAELAADPLGPNRRLGTFTNFGNLCDMAGFAVPIGFSPTGTPIGGVLLGPAWSEGRLAPLADALHRRFAATTGATGQPIPPAAHPDVLAADETGLFCIGAHMAGLSLNSQITGAGGRFVREATTEPCYRLYALGNRPGMVRTADGSAITGELWAVPTASIGALLALVPPPLGFGTVVLDDGPCLGFLAESAGVADATDITHFGGWRAWLRSNSGN